MHYLDLLIYITSQYEYKPQPVGMKTTVTQCFGFLGLP